MSKENANETITENLLTLKETADRLRVTVQTMENYVQQGVIGCYRTRGKVLISEQRHLQAYLKSCECPASALPPGDGSTASKTN